ncbi:hypothetical protein H0H87_000950 [Tephrocybe sp. NHM501043]|nr:hypothetical protein H0H87_000950 [Tephrocybe sp. NHM501043]
MPEPTNEVLVAPSPGTIVAPIHQYTDDQLAKIQALREASPPARASKWNFADAQKRIKATLEWRREFKPDLIPPEEVRIESETGKIIINGFDRDGRPIIYMRPGRENTEVSPRQLRHLVWCLERAKDLMPPGQESLVIIVDYKSTTLRTNPSISVARKVLHILQQHYVETLGRALVVNLPMLLSFFYKGISPFLDPVTRDKMRFNPDLNELIPPEQLDADFGGEHHYEFEAKSYWDQIVAACDIAPDGTRVHKIEVEGSAEASPTPEPKKQNEKADETAPSSFSSSSDTALEEKLADISISKDSTETTTTPVTSHIEQPSLVTVSSS